MGSSAWPLVIGWVASLIVVSSMMVLIAKFAFDKSDKENVAEVLSGLGSMLNTLTGWLPRWLTRGTGGTAVDTTGSQPPEPGVPAEPAAVTLPEVATPPPAVEGSTSEGAA